MPARDLGEYRDEEKVYDRDEQGRKKLRVHPKGTFVYRLAGRDRQKSASYYTPESLTRCVVKYALRELIPDDMPADRILELTVCEPAMGSAALLNEAVNQLAEKYLDRKQGELGRRIPHADYADELQKVRHYIADCNVYGVDLNPVADGDIHSSEWRVALAQRLREHLTFVNLLRVLEGRPKPLSEIVERLRASLPVASDVEAAGVLNGLCALISVARRLEDDTPGPGATAGNDAGEAAEARKLRPFLQVGLHLWVRELRRMVCRLGEPGADEPSRLRFSDDLKADEPSVHLPLIQCRECRVTGWGAVRRPAEQRVDQDLRAFYNRFFSRDIEVKYFFSASPPTGVRGIDASLCDACGFVHAGRETPACAGCGADRLVPVFCPESVVTRQRFADPAPKPWEPNVLSATPTLELGIDIGDLSNVVMCSVPPAPKNYQQRTGRAGRRDGNALTVTVATGQPHDLYFYAEPLDMLASRVDPPGVFLNASAGRGVWHGTTPQFADLFLALPLAAVRDGEPDDMAAIVHLHDDAPTREHPRYRPVWNGVLRLYNLLQFLPGAWWTTRIGVEHDRYPEYARTDQPPPDSVHPDGWEEAMELAAPVLRSAMEQWSALGLPVPEAGFGLIGQAGRVIAEAELGWPEHRVAVLLPEQREWAALFADAGWKVVEEGTDSFVDMVVALLNA